LGTSGSEVVDTYIRSKMWSCFCPSHEGVSGE